MLSPDRMVQVSHSYLGRLVTTADAFVASCFGGEEKSEEAALV